MEIITSTIYDLFGCPRVSHQSPVNLQILHTKENPIYQELLFVILIASMVYGGILSFVSCFKFNKRSIIKVFPHIRSYPNIFRRQLFDKFNKCQNSSIAFLKQYCFFYIFLTVRISHICWRIQAQSRDDLDHETSWEITRERNLFIPQAQRHNWLEESKK